MTDTPLRVLLIEGDHEETAALRSALMGSGKRVVLTEVASFEDARSAFVCYKDDGNCPCENLDVILFDLNIPNGKGLASIREIRSWCTRATIVVHSGLQDSPLEAYFDAGASDFIEKGASHRQVIATVLRACRQARTKKFKTTQWKRLRTLSEGLEKEADYLVSQRRYHTSQQIEPIPSSPTALAMEFANE